MSKKDFPNLKNLKIRKIDSILFRRTEHESVLFNEESGDAFFMNDVAGRVFEEINGRRTVAELIDILQGIFDGEPDGIEKDVTELIEKLIEKKIVEAVG